ncbi:MAG: hypothetical protein ACPG32_12400 [Akkermansiaceae bacterium]
MKLSTLCLLATMGILSLNSLSARTWTSADGKKTFNGDFKSFDESTQQVTVLKRGKSMTFDVSKLSESDREWIIAKVEEQKAGEVTKVLEDQKIGAKLIGGTLSALKDGKFVEYNMTTAPEYYVIYFSGSW